MAIERTGKSQVEFILVSDKFISTEIVEYNSEYQEATWVQVKEKNGPIMIIGGYRIPLKSDLTSHKSCEYTGNKVTHIQSVQL